MPNRTSLIRRLADLRRQFTGETDSTVLPAISRGGQQLDPVERALLLGAICRDYSARLLGDDHAPPLPGRIRAAVLPDATHPGQVQLEAGILAALSRALGYMRLGSPLTAGLAAQPGRALRMVRPQPDELVLHLEPPILAPLMLELLPRITSCDTVAGVPGLRARLHRRHIELYLFGSEPVATVLLANVSYRQWLAAMAFLEAARPESDPLRWTSNHPIPLTPEEVSALSSRPRATEYVHLASAVLRRAWLLGQTHGLCVQPEQPDVLHLSWQAGPSAGWVASRLVHPVVGLLGERFVVTPHPGGLVSIAACDQAATLVLQSTPETELAVMPSGTAWGKLWSAWEQAWSTPNRWMVES
ncbi:hypothetical protein GCM10010174_00450 [Kutzneria viridogrisea]|uniref:Uncharacterized protein n=1 Tax=Kutzneria viridogrisea TaxID=47990 RepID=A0ABR6BCG4_9PSEU|nr:hypothetical protein [Kutzneria viridogrisea]